MCCCAGPSKERSELVHAQSALGGKKIFSNASAGIPKVGLREPGPPAPAVTGRGSRR